METYRKLYEVPYGSSELKFYMPAGVQGTVLHSGKRMPVDDLETAIYEALKNPVGIPPLVQLAGKGDRVCIVFTDITRSCPEHLLVPAILSELERAGVGDEDITLLCAVGMHRPSTRAEKITKLGPNVVERYRVIDHEPQNPEVLVELGFTKEGVPVSCNRFAFESDLIISTGIVEPHQYAGYSGGRKTLSVGAAGEPLIAHTHGPAFLDDPRVRLGKVEGNPFHDAITQAARMEGLGFIINVVLDEDKRVLKISAGDPDKAFGELVEFARSVYEVPVSHQYDIVIGGVGYPKDANLYQASRAASYLFFAPVPVVRKGGFLIIPARCEEGAGAGVGEERFFAAMTQAPDIHHILENARRNGYPPGQQRAFVMAKVLEEAHVVIVGSECPEIVRACRMIPADTIDEALSIAQKKLQKAREILIVPRALLTLPIVTKAEK